MEALNDALAAFIVAQLIEHGLLEKPKGAKAGKVGKAKEEDEVTIDTVKEKLTALVEAKGKAEAVALLKKYKAAKIGDLPEAKWAKFIADVDAATEAGGDEGADDLFGE